MIKGICQECKDSYDDYVLNDDKWKSLFSWEKLKKWEALSPEQEEVTLCTAGYIPLGSLGLA